MSAAEFERHTFMRAGTELSVLDCGAGSDAVVLLHGLAGHGGEWIDTAVALAGRFRVICPDARGHGHSETRPTDVSPAAHAADVSFLVDQLVAGPAFLIGQSFGGTIAMLLAAERPALARGLVLAEAGPGEGDAAEAASVEAYLESWPTPFPDRATAEAFFGGSRLHARRWADGLERRADGLWPRFASEVLVRTLHEAHTRPLWEQWGAIRCPALVVSADGGNMAPAELERMAATNRDATFARIDGAGHDVHLDAAGEWTQVLDGFLVSRPS